MHAFFSSILGRLPSPYREVFEAKEPLLPPYGRLSRYWGELSWVISPPYEHALRHITKHLNPEQHCTADLACGTGRNTGWLINYSQRVFAVDRSPGMLEVARKKLPLDEITFVEADFLSFRLPQPVHLAISSGDSMNYLQDTKELRSALRNVNDALVPGGVFAFDVVDESHRNRATFRCVPQGAQDPVLQKVVTFYQVFTYDPETRIADDWAVFEDALEHHRRRHFTHTQVCDAAQSAGFTVLEAKLSQGLGRVMYVLEKNAAA